MVTGGAIADRIDRLRETMSSLGIGAAIVSHSANRHYFSGFPAADLAPDEVAGVLLISLHEATLFTGPSNLPWAATSVRMPVGAQKWGRPWQAFLGQRLCDRGIGRVAFEDRAMTVADHSAISEAASGVEFVPVGNDFHALRETKDADELASLSEAARVTDAAFLTATESIPAGTTERELAWRIDLAIHEMGASPAFSTCVASGPNGARPHHDSSDRTLREGEPIVIDLGAKVNGYCGDLTRTIVLGDQTPDFTNRYNSVLAAQQAAIAGVRAGMTGGETDKFARDAIVASGFGEQFVHWVGHGVGLLVHEGPVLSPESFEVLKPGNVITIEPGIYFEGWGGIRIEDLCVVTSTGLEILSNAPK